MRIKLAVSAAVLLAAAITCPSAFAEKKKSSSSSEGDATVNKQLEWENRVVGPKKGLDKDHLAAIQEQGRREDEARKKEPPKKAHRAEGIDAPGGVSMPTMDIEKPAAASAKKPSKKVSAAEPKRHDALDNLLEEQGVGGDKTAGGSDAGLGSVLASDDKGSGSGGGAKKSKKAHRR